LSTLFERIGVCQVFLGSNTGVSLPSMSGITPTSAAVSPAASLNNSTRTPVSGSYTFVVCLLGFDPTYGGYTLSQCSSAGSRTVSAGQGVSLTIPASSLPSGYQNAVAMAIFMGLSGSRYQLWEYAYIPPTGQDFNHCLLANPYTSSMIVPGSILSTPTASTQTGSMSPTAVAWQLAGITTGGVDIDRRPETVPISPACYPDYEIIDSRNTTVSFSLLQNDIVNVVQANSGVYVQYAGTNGTIRISHLSPFIAFNSLLAAGPIQLVMPINQRGTSETRTYLGLINRSAGPEKWSKTQATPINFILSPAPNDYLLIGTDTEISYQVN
jgi:hypothetical protein